MDAAETNFYAPPEAPLTTPAVTPRPGPPENVRRAALHGVIAGFQWAFYLVLPFASIGLIVGVVLVLFDAYSHGPTAAMTWGNLGRLVSPFGVLILCSAYGMVIGGVVGTVWSGLRGFGKRFGRSCRSRACSADETICRVETEPTL